MVSVLSKNLRHFQSTFYKTVYSCMAFIRSTKMLNFIFLLLLFSMSMRSALTAEDTKNCGPKMFSGLDRCCDLPKLIPFESVYACLPKENTDQNKAQSNGNSARNKKLNGDQMCLIQCAMNDLNLLTKENDVNITAVNETLTMVAKDHWDTMVDDVLRYCSEEYSKLDLKGVPYQEDNSGKICKPGPFLFISCINHVMTCKCPSQARGEFKDGDTDTCPQRIKNLCACSPFNVLPGWKVKEGKTMSVAGPSSPRKKSRKSRLGRKKNSVSNLDGSGKKKRTN